MPKTDDLDIYTDEDFRVEEIDERIREEVADGKTLFRKEDGLMDEKGKEKEMKKLEDFDLTLKQKDFCVAYILHGGNISRAASEAFNVADVSSAFATGIDCFEKPRVRSAINFLLEKYASSEMIISNLADISLNGKHMPSRVRATELLAKARGVIDKDNGQQVNINLVQIGLPEQKKRRVIDASSDSAKVSGE